MKTFKKLLAGAALSAMFMTSAQAGLLNLGGIMIDPNSSYDWSGTTATITQSVDANGYLSGFGNITTINNELQNVFCPGCELTIVFDGYKPKVPNTIPVANGPAQIIQYFGGSVRLYIDNGSGGSLSTNMGTSLSLASASDGLLWLDMVGHADANGDTLTGINAFAVSRLLTGFGMLDVIGGLAENYLNTNTKPDGADISFTTSFTSFPTSAEFPNGTPTNAFGSGNFAGDTQVPEPGSLALLGLGFAGIAALRRRKVAAQ